jgi:hypothetical protein
MILKPENEVFLNQLQDLKAKEEIQKAENKEIRDNIISKLNIVTLADYKKSLE